MLVQNLVSITNQFICELGLCLIVLWLLMISPHLMKKEQKSGKLLWSQLILVLSTTGCMRREATIFYKRLEDMIVQKRQHPLSSHDGKANFGAGFLFLTEQPSWAFGSKSSFHHPLYGSDITLATSEGRLPSNYNFNYFSLYLTLIFSFNPFLNPHVVYTMSLRLIISILY